MNTYVLGKGKVYFDPFDANGNKTGERELGNCPGVELSVETETLEHYSSESGVQEKDDEVLLKVVRNCALQCDNITGDNISLFIIGDVSSVTQTATPVVGESLGAVKKGRYYQLGVSAANPPGVRGVTGVAVKVSAATKTAGVDYTLDAALGRIYILPGGTIADGDVVTVDYTPNANSRERITAKSISALEGALRYVADNPKGANRDFYAPKVQLKPNGSFQLIGDEWLSLGFTIEFLKKDANTAALYVDGRPA